MERVFRLEAKFKKSEVIKLVLFYPLIVVAVFFLSEGGKQDLNSYLIIFTPPLLFTTWQLVRTLQDKGSILILEEGIHIKRPFDLGLVHWDEVEGIRTEQIRSLDVLCIDLKNPESHKKRLGFVTRRLASASEQRFGTHLTITARFAEGDLEGVQKIITEKLK